MNKVKLITFGFKYGHPICNYWFDVSFLINPVRQPGRSLKDKFDDSMIKFIEEQPETNQILTIIENLALFASKIDDDVRIGIGCNSGRHRSRAIAQLLSIKLHNKIAVEIIHREDL